MKRLLKITGLVLAVLVVLIAGFSFFINTYFTSGRLKALIVPKIEQTTGRKAAIGSISVSLFKGGVVLSDMALARRSGKGDFLSAKELVLKFRLLPLLKKQLVINSLSINSPYILIERAKDGTFNFSDLKKRFEAGRGKKSGPQKKAFNVAIQEVSIKNAKALFIDDMGKLPRAQADADMDFRLRTPPPPPPGKTQTAMPVISGDIDLKSLRMALKNIHSEISGRIKIARQISLALLAVIGKDRINIKGTAVNYQTAPAINLDISSQRLDLGRLIALMPPGGKRKKTAGRPPKAGARPPAKGAASNLNAKGSISIAEAFYKSYTLRDLNADWGYSRGAFSVNPFKTSISGGDKIIVQGNLQGSARFGKLGQKNTLSGKGRARFSKIMVKESPIAGQIAILLGMPELSNPTFTDSLMDYGIKDGNTSIDGYFNSADVQFNPVKGTIGLNKALDISVDLDLSPAVSPRVGIRNLRFLKNKMGWTVVPLRITGTTQKPHVSISRVAARKAIEKGLGEEIRKGLQRLFK